MAKSKLHQEIFRKFIESLKEEENFSDKMANEIYQKINLESKLKPEELILLFSEEKDVE